MNIRAVDSLIDILGDFEASTAHEDDRKNSSAKLINILVGRAIYELETSGDEADVHFAYSVWRVAQRLVIAENLNLTEPPPSGTLQKCNTTTASGLWEAL